MYVNWKKSLFWALALTVVLSTAGAALAAKGGNKPPKDPPPPSDPPPVLYELRLFSMPGDYAGGTAGPEEMNDLGEVVGYYRVSGNTVLQPFYIDVASAPSAVTNLNDLELDEGFSVPAGWYIYVALGINNAGDIVGALALSSDRDVMRGFVLELRPDPLDTSLKPRLHLIPDEAWSHTYARRINDAGEILGRGDNVTSYIYRPALHGLSGDVEVSPLPFAFDAWWAHLNNPTADHDAQIVTFAGGDLVRYTLGVNGGPEILNVDVQTVIGLSDSGSFCGSQSIQVKRKRFERLGYWYDGILHDLPDVVFAQDINADDDVVGSGVLYHSQLGALDLGEIVVAANEFEQQLWIDGGAGGGRITERGITGTDPALAEFPAIAGPLRRFDTEFNYFYDVFVLLPLATP